jgi:hypothetical protein
VNRWGTVGSSPLSHQAISNLIAEYAPAEFSAHSLRIGYTTQARLDGIPEWKIMAVTRHTSEKMIHLYTRPLEQHRAGPGTLLKIYCHGIDLSRIKGTKRTKGLIGTEGTL